MVALRIQSHSHAKATALVPEDWFDEHNCQQGQSVTMKFGQRQVDLQLAPNTTKDRIYLPISVIRYLYLKSGLLLNVSFNNNTLHLGPLVGIMTTPLGKASARETIPVEAKRSLFFSRFIKLGYRKHALFFVFHPQDIDWQQGLVTGYALPPYQSEGLKWVKTKFPLPDVVWNRVPHRGAEKKREVVEAKKRIAAVPAIQLFPQDYFYKWQMFEVLEEEGSISNHLPETIKLITVDDVLKMLKKHRSVFVKATSGSHGHGIIRFERSGYNLHYSYHHHNGRLVQGLLHNPGELKEFIMTAVKRRENIVQQGLDLAKYKGSPFDIRATVQKDREGAWQVAGLSLKVAGDGSSVTTHVCNGGSVVPINWLLAQLYPDANQQITRLNQFAIKTAEAIERASGWNLGELGMDIAIDTNDKLWLFEINSKPGRVVFAPDWAKEDRQRSYELLVEYSIYLGGFGPQKQIISQEEEANEAHG